MKRTRLMAGDGERLDAVCAALGIERRGRTRNGLVLAAHLGVGR